MSMVSDQEIAREVEVLLRQPDPTSATTLNGVVQRLEAKLGLDLSHKAGFIRDHISLLLSSHQTQTTSRDHFTLQHYPHQQFPPHFALQNHSHFPSDDLSSRQNPQSYSQSPITAQPPPQVQPQPVVEKTQVFSQNAATLATPEVPKESWNRGGPAGLKKVCRVSPALQVIVGEPALPIGLRLVSQITHCEELWAYIRKNSLQDPSNKRKIICDDALRLVCETDCTDMFKMNKLLAKHITAFEPSKDSSHTKRVQVDTESITESVEPSANPVIISEALAKFLDAGGRETLATEAERHVWEYIKVNHLEDPANPMVVLCDGQLRKLLGCESISVMGIRISFLSEALSLLIVLSRYLQGAWELGHLGFLCLRTVSKAPSESSSLNRNYWQPVELESTGLVAAVKGKSSEPKTPSNMMNGNCCRYKARWAVNEAGLIFKIRVGFIDGGRSGSRHGDQRLGADTSFSGLGIYELLQISSLRSLFAPVGFISAMSFVKLLADYVVIRYCSQASENGLLFVPKGQAQNAQAQMFSDPNMAMDMMKKNLSMIIPQTLTFAWVNFFFSGFVAAKIPFPLTQRFRSMLQNGIDLSTVDVSYVSSRSWYFLNLFGLRGLFSLILGEENAMDDTQRMMQMSGFGFDPSKSLGAEKDGLDIVQHEWALPKFEHRAETVLKKLSAEH
ncbi:SWIB complex BAF60b domain-containing protein, putative isoform 3 [Hibiscus syriacus]|uniref:ER membrane protein complex subunit 3 n=3 Tax=Magnoliopsida TaxID=3398 RepID=A0A6A3C6A0_HIBSY|nr:SWIB complex BAF60b domain-containing protein, putative isoform 3 [Hibiscus syriacus]